MPAAAAPSGSPSGTARPSIVTLPASGATSPNSALASAVRPEPSRPEMPSTSPACRSKPMSWKAPAFASPRTSSRRGAPGASGAGGVSATSRPVMWRVSEAASNSPAGPSATFRPLRSTTTCSQTSSTSASLWLTKSTATPSALSRRMIPSSTRTSRSVSAVVGSSMMMSRASEASARQIATSCLCATDSVSTRASSGISTPTRSSIRAASARTRRRSTSRRPACSSALKAMFSATERFGKSEKSWKITMIPAAADCRGVSRREALAGHRDARRVRLLDAREDLDQRRLAAAVLAGERHRLALADREADAVERPDPGVALSRPMTMNGRSSAVEPRVNLCQRPTGFHTLSISDFPAFSASEAAAGGPRTDAPGPEPAQNG